MKPLGEKPKNKEHDELINFALLVKLIANLGFSKINYKSLMSEENSRMIIKKLRNLPNEYEGIKVLGYKSRNIPTKFKPNSTTNP